GSSDAPTVSQQPPGEGAVAFLGDVPVQLATGAADELIVWDIAGQRPLKKLKAPGEVVLEQSLSSLTPDGKFAAAVVRGPSEKGSPRRELIAVWDVAAEKLLAVVTAQPTALTLAPDGRVLAAGTRSGAINVWSLPDGQLRATLHNDHNEVRCLAFGPNAWTG